MAPTPRPATGSRRCQRRALPALLVVALLAGPAVPSSGAEAGRAVSTLTFSGSGAYDARDDNRIWLEAPQEYVTTGPTFAAGVQAPPAEVRDAYLRLEFDHVAAPLCKGIDGSGVYELLETWDDPVVTRYELFDATFDVVGIVAGIPHEAWIITGRWRIEATGAEGIFFGEATRRPNFYEGTVDEQLCPVRNFWGIPGVMGELTFVPTRIVR